MFKVKGEEFLAHPFHTSALVSIFALLIFLPVLRPPVVISVLLVTGLVYFSMYFGAVFSSSAKQ